MQTSSRASTLSCHQNMAGRMLTMSPLPFLTTNGCLSKLPTSLSTRSFHSPATHNMANLKLPMHSCTSFSCESHHGCPALAMHPCRLSPSHNTNIGCYHTGIFFSSSIFRLTGQTRRLPFFTGFVTECNRSTTD